MGTFFLGGGGGFHEKNSSERRKWMRQLLNGIISPVVGHCEILSTLLIVMNGDVVLGTATEYFLPVLHPRPPFSNFLHE